jgi:ribosomal protein S18 acetylase RimI-like enzyme
MSVEVRLAAPSDAAGIGALFARAFAADPVTSWVTPDSARRAGLLQRLNTAIARHEGIPRGSTYVAETPAGLVGAAVWQPPGQRPVNWRAPQYAVPFALTAGLALGRDIPRMTAAGRAAAKARPRRPHWYLQLLGVDPAAQHSGVGSAIVLDQLRRIDEQRQPAYLETTVENLEFYERFGFEVTGELAMPSGAPTEYSLLRESR